MIKQRFTLDKAGIYQLPADVYHADPCPAPSLSSTLAKTMIAQSPLHAWDKSPLLNPNYEQADSKTFDIGRAAHRAVLGKGEGYVAIPNDMLASNGAASTKAAKEFIEVARASGLTPLKADEVDQIGSIAEKVRAKLDRMGIEFDPAHSEVTAIAQIDGVWCRAMIDNAPTDPLKPLYDLKTCEDASPQAVERSIMNYGYQLQAQHYIDVWKAATGEDRAFCFVFVEKKSPHEVTLARIANGTMVIARKQAIRAREMWANCIKAKNWPGYPDGIMEIDLPAYWQERWLERESVEADHKQRTGSDILELARRFQSPEGL
jgi:hypothetical protein